MITPESPEGPEHEPEDALGFTISNREYMMYDPDPNKSWRICIFINLSQTEMLMRDGLNSAERMTIQWSIANTVYHLNSNIRAPLMRNRLYTRLCMPCL